MAKFKVSKPRKQLTNFDKISCGTTGAQQLLTTPKTELDAKSYSLVIRVIGLITTKRRMPSLKFIILAMAVATYCIAAIIRVRFSKLEWALWK